MNVLKWFLPIFALVSACAFCEDFNYTPYQYRAEVVDIYDADTMTVLIDLGFGTYRTEKIRLYGIDAWEVRGPEREDGIKARDWMRRQCPEESVIFLSTVKDKKGKYGRYLATVYILENGKYRNLNEELVSLGHAEKKTY